MFISDTSNNGSVPITRKRIHPAEGDEGRCEHLEWSKGNISKTSNICLLQEIYTNA